MTRQEQEKKYEKAPTKEYDDCPLYSWRSEEWYTDIDDYWEQTDDSVEESQDPELKEEWDAAKTTAKGVCDYGFLYMSEPNYLPTLEFNECVELPDNCEDLSDILKPDHPISLKLAELNQLIEETKFVVSYFECKFKPDPETLGFKYQ
jgi:hypothetical protein